MNRRNLLASVFATVILVIAGCSTVVPNGTLERIQKVAEGSAFTGVTADLLTNPQHRPEIVGALKALDAVIASGRITGTQLASIMATLPVKSETVTYVGSALVIYDALSVLWWSPSSDSVAMAVASGFSNGTHLALAQSPEVLKQIGKVRAAATKIPTPTADNIRQLR